MIEYIERERHTHRDREKWIDELCHNDVIFFVLQEILNGNLCMV